MLKLTFATSGQCLIQVPNSTLFPEERTKVLVLSLRKVALVDFLDVRSAQVSARYTTLTRTTTEQFSKLSVVLFAPVFHHCFQQRDRVCEL